ncbi:MAG: Amuc_1100 family pilus-like protein [Kiritimatiellae bacterium]|nr:Amuc_1100 family pilus-like protein [Kiritimatiellia bacterium]
MSKNKLVMCVIGGVAGVLALAIGWLVYSESDAQEAKRAELQTQQSAISQNAWADPKAAKAHKDNKKAIDDWADDAFKRVSEMARPNPHRGEAPAAFRLRMFKKQRELMKLPAGSETKIIKDTFYFGERFKDFIDPNTAANPAEADVPALQREWGDVVHFTEILLKSGATELTAVTVVQPPKPVEENKPRRGGRGPSRSAEKVNPYPSTEKNYEFTFLARPEALIKVLNAVASDKDRFMAIDSISFEQADDPLKKILGEGEKEKKDNAGGRRRGGRRSGGLLDSGKEEEEDVIRKGLVTNPETAAPFTVVMKVSTIVFAKADDAKAKGGRK